MNFHWTFNETTDEQLKKFCIELEYQLRRKITRFLMDRVEKECQGDFSCFHFEVDMVAKRIALSPKTPSRFRQLIEADFETEINHNCC
ncbi:hypothetical protein FK220_002210 [Flavobacteriaceae bacterium TP-CH-4]|uniref:Uncharacterized protein n=1 Tax=Pelagihabitans pacificus TaxID=2696054 RepID=A0A967AV40_9FLAO|nr:hypothetical protein [Pelagihabitans pacificus]NHF58137.1 hypothetical protein [Pelagihabitans pacificus]